MKLHELTNTVPRQARKRKGRGDGNNWGRTAGKGEKGQMARSGACHRPYFEGGQTPFFRKLPKRGFTSKFHKQYAVVNLGTLERLFTSGDTVCADAVMAKGLLDSIGYGLKVLGHGTLTHKLTVKAAAFSASARAAIEAAGGTCEECGC